MRPECPPSPHLSYEVPVIHHVSNVCLTEFFFHFPTQANWPFDDNAVYANIGTETEINLPTQNSIYVYTGSYTWSFLIDFYNADSLTYGNWPTGTCSGPYSLGEYASWANPTEGQVVSTPIENHKLLYVSLEILT